MTEIKNAILLTIDCLRADHLSCLGYHRETTPQLDRIAKRGILFLQAISNGNSTPTAFRPLLTSTPLSMYNDDKYLSRYRVTIQEALKRNGFTTAAFHSNPYLSSYFGYSRGFDTFVGISDIKKDILIEGIKERGVKSLYYEFLFRLRLTSFRLKKLYKFSKGEPFARACTLNEMATSWIEKQDKNFFVWIHYMDVHTPYVPPKEYLRLFTGSPPGILGELILYLKTKFERRKDLEMITEEDLKLLIDLYDAEIRYVDAQIGLFLENLREMGVLDETLIIITADHGEEFCEHGTFGHAKFHLYDELLHIPLIIYAPAWNKRKVIEEQVELMSIAPTIADILGLSEEKKHFMGKSLVPLIEDTEEGSEYVVSEASRSKISYREPEWKCIFDCENGKIELYNLQNDPKERENIAQKEKEKVREFQQKLLKYKKLVEEERIKRKIKNSKFSKRI